MPQSSKKTSTDNEMESRRAAMSTLSRARRDELESVLEHLSPLPAASDLRPAEVGLVMLRGRTGGDGAPFNLGEATVSRATLRIEAGATGFGYRLGRDVTAARHGALIDALWQDPARRPAVEAELAPIRARLAAERQEVHAETAATKVDFFTLVRGED